jgi:hypothetical protein
MVRIFVEQKAYSTSKETISIVARQPKATVKNLPNPKPPGLRISKRIE